jgi:1,4-dihydroxy-2-naphthoate octaprenyltransferase
MKISTVILIIGFVLLIFGWIEKVNSWYFDYESIISFAIFLVAIPIFLMVFVVNKLEYDSQTKGETK